MVLLCRTESPSAGNSLLVLTGDGDVAVLLLYSESVLMRKKNEAGKKMKRFRHLDGSAFEFFFKKYTVNVAINLRDLDVLHIKQVFIEKFSGNEELQYNSHNNIGEHK